MTLRIPAKFVLIATLAVAGGSLAGCATQTEGDRALNKAARMEDGANMIKRGESMVQDGAAEEARGKTVRDQGDVPAGERLINAGQATQKQGKALIEQGRKMQM